VLGVESTWALSQVNSMGGRQRTTLFIIKERTPKSGQPSKEEKKPRREEK
jgi:hypothetical protein